MDLVIEFETGQTLAIEVETSPGHELENLRKDLGAGFTHITSLIKGAPRTRTIQSSVEAKLSDVIPTGSHVSIGALTDFRDVLTRFLGMKRS